MAGRGRTIFEHEGSVPPEDSGRVKEDESKLKPDPETAKPADPPLERGEEIGGPKGPEPTRYGDWEKGGRCSDF